MADNKVQCFDFGAYRLDITNNQLLKNDVQVSLTQRSFEILRLLVENRGRVLKKDEFLDSLWEEDFVEEATLTQHIYMLRKVLKDGEDDKKFIETIPKNGYRFIAEVSEISYEKPHFTPIEKNFPLKKNGNSNGKYFYHKPSTHLTKSAKLLPRIIRKKTGNKIQFRNIFASTYVFLGVFTVLIVLALGFVFFSFNSRSNKNNSAKINSIAVLPFQQIGGKKDEKVGLGTTDVLISKLGKFENLSVLPMTSTIVYADKIDADLAEIGEKFNVDAVLTGTIQQDNDLIRVTVQLYDVNDKMIIWSEIFDEGYSNIFSLQDNVSEKISGKLSLKIRNNNFAPEYAKNTGNREAHQAYLMGIFYWSKHTSDGFKEAIQHFQRAIEKDSNFAPAYARLADSYAHFYHISEIMPRDEAIAKSREMANKALELDPNCADAMTALALTYVSENRHSEAFELLTKAIEIDPNNANAHQRLSRLYANGGELEKAVAEMNLAHNLNPESNYISLSLAEFLNLARRPDEAINYTNKVLQTEPNSAPAKWRLAESLEQKGQFKEAVHQLKEISTPNENNPTVMLALSRIYAKDKKEDEAREILRKIISDGNADEQKNFVAYTYASLGESNEAMKWLKESELTKDVEVSYILKFEPNLDSLRNEPEFQKVLEEVEAVRKD